MPEKDVTARVRVEREGDAGAVRELADDLRTLEPRAEQAAEALEKASRGVDSLAENLDEASESLGKTRESLRDSSGDVGDLSEAFETRFPKATKAVVSAAAAVVAFKESFNATRAAVEFFQSEFGINIDEIVSDALRLEELGERIVNFFEGSGEATSELLQNQRRIFENLGLDGLSSNVERNAQIIEEHFRSIGDTISTGSQFLSRYGLDAQEATEKAKTFAAEFNAALEVNPDIDLEGLGERVGSQIDQILESLRDSGAAIPDEFAAIIERLNSLGNDLDFSQSLEKLQQFRQENERLAELRGAEELKGQVMALLDEYTRLGENAPAEIQKIADAMGVTSTATAAELEKIRGLLGLLPADTRQSVDAISQAWESLDPNEIRQRFQFLDEEEREKFREAFRQYVETVKAGGGEISQEVAALGSSIGVLTSAWEPVGGAADSAADQLVTAARRGAEGIGELSGAVDSAAGDVSGSSDQIAQSITVWVTKLDEAGNTVTKVQTITAEAASKMTLSELEAADPRLREYVRALKEAEKGLGETKTSADETGKSLGEPANQAGELGKGVESLANAAQNLKAAEGGSAAGELARGLEEISKAAGDTGAAEKIDAIKTSLESLNAWDNSGILGSLDAVIAKLDEAAQAARNLDSATADSATAGGEGGA